MNINGQKLSLKDIYKKINWQLSINFFTLEETKSMSPRKLKKILKYIAKIERIKINKKELNELVIFIQSNFEKGKDAAIKIWDFISNIFTKKTIIKDYEYILENQVSYSSYVEGRFEVMLN